MAYKTYSFEKLEVYQLARQLRLQLNQMVLCFPKSELYDLVSQIKRASGSVTANIAEGSARATTADKAHFTNIAYASCMEIIDHLNASFDLKYIEQKLFEDLRIKVDLVCEKLSSLYKYQLNTESSLKTKLKK